MEWLRYLRSCFDGDAVYYTQHAKLEMNSEEFGPILDSEIGEAVSSGEILKEYLDDDPYPSVLVFGLTRRGRPIHVVCACDTEGQRAIVITAYQPNPAKWIDYRTRRTS